MGRKDVWVEYGKPGETMRYAVWREKMVGGALSGDWCRGSTLCHLSKEECLERAREWNSDADGFEYSVRPYAPVPPAKVASAKLDVGSLEVEVRVARMVRDNLGKVRPAVATSWPSPAPEARVGVYHLAAAIYAESQKELLAARAADWRQSRGVSAEEAEHDVALIMWGRAPKIEREQIWARAESLLVLAESLAKRGAK